MCRQGSSWPRGSAQQSLCVEWEEQSWRGLLCTFRTSFVLRADSQFTPSAEQCLFPSTGNLCYWEFSGSTFSSNSQFPREFPEQVHTSPWHITHHSAPSARTHTGCPLCNSLIWQQRSSANSPKALKIILKAPIPLLIMNLPFLTPGTSSHDSHFHSLPSSPASESTASSPKFAAPCCFSLFCRGKLSAATA